MKRTMTFAFMLVVLCAVVAEAKTITPKKLEKTEACYSYVENRVYHTQDCYYITNAEELYGFVAMVNGDAGFEKDSLAFGYIAKSIVVNEKVLNEDGSLVENTEDLIPWVPMKNFSGGIYTSFSEPISISGLYFNDPTADNVGLVGNYVSAGLYMGGVTGQLTIKDSYFEGHTNVGAFCGYDDNNAFASMRSYSYATVKGVSAVGGITGKIKDEGSSLGENYGTVICSEGNCGGIVGTTKAFRVEYGTNYGNVICLKGDCGGVVGHVDSLENTFGEVVNYGSVTCSEGNCGGIAGSVENIVNLYWVGNEGKVSGDVAGGIVGFARSNEIILKNSYNTGDIYGESYAGGLIGKAVLYDDMDSKRYLLETVYNIGKISGEGETDVFINGGHDFLESEMCFYLDGVESSVGTSATSEQFENGLVAAYLMNGSNKSVFVHWGQVIGTDKHPWFSRNGVEGAEFKVTLDLNGGTLEGDCPKTYLTGENTWLPVAKDSETEAGNCTISRDGYLFLGWLPDYRTWDDDEKLDKNLRWLEDRIDTTVLFDREYKAIWTDTTFMVTYYISGEVYRVDTVVFNAPYTVIDDLPETEEFWYDEWSKSGTFNMPGKDVDITTRRHKNEFTVYFVDTAMVDYPAYYERLYDVPYGDTVTAPDTIPTSMYYSFVAWSADGENEFDYSTPITSDTKLYALWTLTEDSVCVEVNGKSMWVSTYKVDSRYYEVVKKIEAALEGKADMVPAETYSDDIYDYTFTGKWDFDDDDVYRPQYTKMVRTFQIVALLDGVEEVVTINAKHTKQDIDDLITAAVNSNRNMHLVKTYRDDEYVYKFIGWEKNGEGYYVPVYSAELIEMDITQDTTKQEPAKQDTTKQDIAKQDSTKTGETAKDTTKQDSGKDTKKDTGKDTKKDSGKESIPVFAADFASLEVHGLNVSVAGLAKNSRVAVFDMLGHAVAMPRVANGTCNVKLLNAGTYFVRIDKRTYKVSVK